MKKMKNALALLLALCMTTATLVGCGGATDKFDLVLSIASEPEHIDPTLNSSVDGAIMIQHMFEGLMKWKDDGNGNALLVEGQAESVEKGDVQSDGTVTYTFKLRNDAKWSDGKKVTADNFVFSLQRLLDPETASDYNYMADMILNASEIMASEKTKDTLGVVAVDEKTLEITLTYDCPYFLEVAAFPALFPVRQDIIESKGDQWTFEPSTYIGNGAYKMSGWVHNSEIKMIPNKNYYDVANLGPDSITFKLMDDNNAMLADYKSGGLNFINHFPVDEIQALKDSGELIIVDYIGTYYACFQNEKAPFDDVRVREAFSLVIDRNYIVNEITRSGEAAATGYVPAGVTDADPAKDDFRTTGGDYYSVSDEDYQKNCDRARELLVEAGFPGGEGFPVVEYLYNTNDNHKAIGEALQNMWLTELGVKVELDNQDWNVFLRNRKDGEYDISRNGWIADYNDPISFLDMFLTGGGNNDAQYSNAKFDEKIKGVQATADQVERMKLMHEAEDILVGEDSAVAPIYFYTQKYLLNKEIKGMYYTPLGYFFFGYTTLEGVS